MHIPFNCANYKLLVCTSAIPSFAGKAFAGYDIIFDNKPYVRFMLARPINPNGNNAVYIDLRDWHVAVQDPSQQDV